MPLHSEPHRNVQTPWYTIGYADYLSSLLTYSCAHLCVLAPCGYNGCLVLFSFFRCYIPIYLVVLGNVQCTIVLVLFLSHDSSNHSQCVSVPIVVIVCPLSAKFLDVCLSFEPSSVQSSFLVPRCRSIFSQQPLHQRYIRTADGS